MAFRDLVIGCGVGVVVGGVLVSERDAPGPEDSATVAASAARGVAQTCADFAAIGTFQAPSVTEAGVIATGSGDINVLEFNGLGIVGGDFDIRVETGETIRFDFDGFQADGVTYHISYAGNGDGDGTSGEALLTAFGFDGGPLGTVSVGSTGAFDVTTLFGGLLVSGFELQPKDGDALRVDSVCYEQDLVVCVADLDGDGDTDVLDFAEFLIDFGCGAP